VIAVRYGMRWTELLETANLAMLTFPIFWAC
jgi:hypothetical protein